MIRWDAHECLPLHPQADFAEAILFRCREQSLESTVGGGGRWHQSRTRRNAPATSGQPGVRGTVGLFA